MGNGREAKGGEGKGGCQALITFVDNGKSWLKTKDLIIN